MRQQGSNIFYQPELILADVLQREARGGDKLPAIQRAVVLAVDLDGGMLQNSLGEGSLKVTKRDGTTQTVKALVGADNPRGAIKARVLTNGLDRLLDDDDVRVFWPLLPTDQLGIPVSPGEHVYVLWEDNGTEHGLWISRVSGQDSANSFSGVESYTAPNSPGSAVDFFEGNSPAYPTDDNHAGEAPTPNLFKLFGE